MAATITSVGVVVRTMMIVLLCVMVAAFAYLIAIDGLSSCFDMHARWAIAMLTDFSIYIAVITAWIVYKESSWIITPVLLLLLCTIGSVATCGYILVQFFKLSPEKSSRDPLYFVLARHPKRKPIWAPSVLTARIIFSALGCLLLGALIYTIIIDLSPFHAKAFAPCFLTYITDIYIHAVILSIWIAYKESSWISAFFWILFLLCLGNITTCIYIVRELFYLSPHDPISLVIFNNKNRNLESSDSPLVAHTNV